MPDVDSGVTLRGVKMAKGHAPKVRSAPNVRRKNLLIDQRKLDAAKTALGASTETAAVDAALDVVVFQGEVFGALDRLASVDAFGGARRPRRAG